jgi:hypothetical protein
MLPLAPRSAEAQRRGIGSRATCPSPTGETSAGQFLAPQVVLLRSRRRVATGSSLAALVGSVRSQDESCRSSTFLRPFAPRPLRRFNATMDALTPVEPALRLGAHEHRPNTPQVSLRYVPCLPTLPSPTTPRRPTCMVWFRHAGLPEDAPHRKRLIPFRDQCVIWASPFPSRLATTTGRIAFVILRTSRSPPVALHPASRRRSYVRLRGSDQTSARTYTSLTKDTYKRTRTAQESRPTRAT